MRNILLILVCSVTMTAYAQEAVDNENVYDEDYDFGMAEGITIYGERSIDAYVLKQLNGLPSDRKRFIQTDFLEEAGFQKSGNAKYRKTNASEKTISLLHDFFRGLSLGLLPISGKPFHEIEYDKLPKGEYYRFESVFIKSRFKDVTPAVLTIIELEYMLQIEFCNGIIIQENIKYYTDENINRFEALILDLPDYPENIKQVKSRYVNELQRIKAALERNRNPSEDYLRALQNLGDSFNKKR